MDNYEVVRLFTHLGGDNDPTVNRNCFANCSKYSLVSPLYQTSA